MSRDNNVYGIGATRVIIPPGATRAFLMQPVAGELTSTIKYFEGGSLEIIGATLGVSFTPSFLVSLLGKGYLVSTNEAVNINGPARYYMMATGATSIAYILKGLSQGF